jgi:formylglycine-generating enzyme required for sulfatase activity
LHKAFPGKDVKELFKAIKAIHNLSELSSRPFTLNLVRKYWPKMEAYRQSGKPVYAITLYELITAEEWVSVDECKSEIPKDFKPTIAAHMAAFLHRQESKDGERKGVPAKELKEWLLERNRTDATFNEKCGNIAPEQLGYELCDAIFLVSDDDPSVFNAKRRFRFAHRSIHEYFLAKYLFDSLNEDKRDSWDIHLPSLETLDFLGQLFKVAEHEGEWDTLSNRLGVWGQRYLPLTSELLLHYSLYARDKGWPQIFVKDRRHPDFKPKELRFVEPGPQAAPSAIDSSHDEWINSIGMNFVRIKADRFKMGSDENDKKAHASEKPLREVRISRSFYLGKFPVTQGEWKEVMGNNPSGYPDNDRKPVESVSWYDVQEFIYKLNQKEGRRGYRLPTEAEWEYACRAKNDPSSENTDYCFGSVEYGEDKLENYAWYNQRDGTSPVGEKRFPNPWGLYDMHGNVWEWVQDWYGDYPDDEVRDPQGPLEGSYRVYRGGCWDYFASYCRSAYRFRRSPGFRFDNVGFRLALSPEQQQAGDKESRRASRAWSGAQ